MIASFFDLPQSCRFIFGLWALFICMVSLANIVFSFAVKRYRYGTLSLVPFAFAYFLWQINLAGLTKKGIEQAAAQSIKLDPFFWNYWYIVLLGLTLAAIVPLYLCRRYAKNQITPLVIKRCADEMDCGICYWRDNGHVVFSNDCINKLSLVLTGKLLMDGNAFREAVAEGILPVGQRVWNFTVRDIQLDGESVHEMIATDVTDVHAKREKLRKDNEKLSRLSEELRAYGLKIDETVRRQEVLQAKVNIHDEMNRLMLSTLTADIDNNDELNRVFSLWEKNTLFLCMETEEKKNENAAKQLAELAQALNLQLVWHNQLPDTLTRKQRELFFATAQEAVTNAVKHAETKKLELSFSENQTEICCTFENGGIVPQGEISFTGGLLNLSLLAGEQNASVSAENGDVFRLSLRFSKPSSEK